MRAALLGLVALFSVACTRAPEGGATPPKRSARCAGCHMQDYLDATDPVHVDEKPTACGVCHTQIGWHPHVLQHEFWPLTGAHEAGHCFYCHEGNPPVFEGTPKECYGCHQQDFERSRFPGHSHFAHTCGDCHDTTRFSNAVYDAGPAEHDAGVERHEAHGAEASRERVREEAESSLRRERELERERRARERRRSAHSTRGQQRTSSQSTANETTTTPRTEPAPVQERPAPRQTPVEQPRPEPRQPDTVTSPSRRR